MAVYVFTVCFVGVLFSVTPGVLSNVRVTVTTGHGDVRGYRVNVDHRPNDVTHLDVFTGIPYAKPPVGDLRWRKPEEPTPWKGSVYNATYFRPSCPQELGTMHDWHFDPPWNNTSEDCLYLNVYSPHGGNTTDRNPVLVYIHGGNYYYEGAEGYDARILAQYGVVVVTINYRLGVLGYLSTEDEHAAGNYGMFDQTLALTWVKNNIENFRGDSSRVTIFGESAGGASVSLHLFSPKSRGLFAGVIAQSGAMSSYWTIRRLPETSRKYAMELGKLAGCDQRESEALLKCLRTKNANHLVDLGEKDVSSPPFTSTWVPVIDADWMPKDPRDLLKEGSFYRVPLMTGTCLDDGSDELIGVENVTVGFSKAQLFAQFRERAERWGWKREYMYDTSLLEYNEPWDNPIRNRNLNIELETDDAYLAPAHNDVMGHSRHYTAYQFVFAHRSSNMPKPQWSGVPHGEELYYVFGAPFWGRHGDCPWGCHSKWGRRQEWSVEDRELSKSVMTIWSNFAKTGNPNPIPDVSVTWPNFVRATQSHFVINATSYVESFYRHHQMSFWNEYWPSLETKLDKLAVPPTSPTPTSACSMKSIRSATFLMMAFSHILWK